MNLLKPQIIKIGNRRYRKNPYISNNQNENLINEPYEEETAEMFMATATTTTSCKINNEYNDEACCIEVPDEDLTDITSLDIGIFQYTMDVSESYFGFIIGKNGEKKMNLERETSTKLIIPPRNKGQYVTIEGKTKSSVASCRNRLNIIISTVRHKNPFTHFLSFPLNFEHFKSKQIQFKEQVLKSCTADRGIDATIFQNENKLHLTICTLTLIGNAEIDQAYELLDDCRKTFIKDLLFTVKDLDVHIKGLEYMNDDPSEVDVIYAKVNPIDSDGKSLDLIQTISNKLMKKFVESGLSKKQYDSVKLHATVMNSLMRHDPSGTSTAVRKANNKLADRERESFDARNVLKQFGDFDFGYFKLDEIHLSVRFSTSNSGYYEYVSKINL